MLVLALYAWFLAIVNSRSRSLYAVAGPSVVCLSETFVHLTQSVEIFRNFSTPFGTMAVHWHPPKILPRSSQGNPPSGELNARGVAKYSDIGLVERYIPETVKDRR